MFRRIKFDAFSSNEHIDCNFASQNLIMMRECTFGVFLNFDYFCITQIIQHNGKYQKFRYPLPSS